MNITSFDPSALLNESEQMEFLSLGAFDKGECGAFWSGPGPTSPWEMHPECDELLHVLEGKIEVEILPEDGSESITTFVHAGGFVIIPQGCWHRQTMLEKTKEFYTTPGATLHSTSDDPRAQD
ncbi:MAG: cupin domain-containing protein [Pseudohongiellaceae bacterium]